jgi:SpoVK/Ycf46/Vps4 family AAA+-type ATPase
MTEAPTQPYEHAWEHLQDEMRLLDLLTRREVLRFRQSLPKEQADLFKGMFISDGEIDRLLGEERQTAGEAEDDELASLDRAAARCRQEIARRKQASLENGAWLTLPRLTNLFGLSSFEEQALLICLAPELDAKYEKLFAYLQDDVTRKQPSVELILRLLRATPRERLWARASFAPQATLFRSHILRCLDGEDSPLPARRLRPDEMIVSFLLGGAGVSQELSACCRAYTEPGDLGQLRWPDEVKSRLASLTRSHVQDARQMSRRLIYHFPGPAGTGRKALAAGLCREIGAPLLIVDLREMLSRAQNFEETLRRALREGLLQTAAIFLEHFDMLLGDDPKAISQQQCLARAIGEFSWLTFIATEKDWEPGDLFQRHLYLSFALPAPDLTERAALWETMTKGGDTFSPEIDWPDLATKYRLTPGQMQAALVAARNQARTRDYDHPVMTAEDLIVGCRRQSNQKLAALARRLAPRQGWEDITLPEQSLTQLREICAQVRHRRKVYGQWGFGRKQTTGKGLCVLFYGLSGTGKTLAVEVTARELNLEAFKIDLSTVVSKYIGETEKNLSRVFDEAENSNAILFFDEADALFGKRSEVKDAHDRYANIEINYLLQRMEEFDGLAILATNLRKHIDEAFFRRMHFAVEFPLPDEKQRYHIWKQHLPETAPMADDIDYGFLANRLNLAGGNIRNIVVNAAFLAAENSGVIHMRHFIRAARREYEKTGRICTADDFAPYHNLL